MLADLDIPDTARPIPISQAAGLPGAAAVNSHLPDQAIQQIDKVDFPAYGHLTALLRRAWEEVTWQAI